MHDHRGLHVRRDRECHESREHDHHDLRVRHDLLLHDALQQMRRVANQRR